MDQLLSIPGLVEVGAPALGLGILVGGLLAWLIVRSRLQAYQAEIKTQQALQQEREIAFEAARSQLTAAFSDLANRSLRSNSETFLRLAEQNLGTQRERAKRDLTERCARR